MKIKVMIAEDERFAREELEYLLNLREDIVLCSSVTNGKELLLQYDLHLPDVVMLDIHMPEIEGLSVAKQLLSKKQPPLIIFTTAYEEYAVEAFGLDAVDYLLKPYSDERLDEALNRVRKEINRNSQVQVQPIKSNLDHSSSEEKVPTKLSKLLLDDGERLIVIDPKSVYYMMREDRAIRIFTPTQVYQSKLTLQELEEKLVPFNFFRCHRSYLVNLHYIHEIMPWFNGAYNIILKDKEKTKIPVSRSSVKELLQILQM
jgi:two-component system response regulator LytT